MTHSLRNVGRRGGKGRLLSAQFAFLAWTATPGGFKEVSEREMDNLIAALEDLRLF